MLIAHGRCRLLRPIQTRLEAVVRDARWGRYYDYPACCIAAYCWDTLLGRAPSWHRAMHDLKVGDELPFVPCGVFHARNEDLGRGRAAWRIVRLELRIVTWRRGEQIRHPLRARRDRMEVTHLRALYEREVPDNIVRSDDFASESLCALDQQLAWS